VRKTYNESDNAAGMTKVEERWEVYVVSVCKPLLPMHFGRVAMKNMKGIANHVYVIHRPGSYVYVNTDSAGTSIPMILNAKRKKKR